MPEYMTTAEVAAYLRLNPKKVYTLVADGRIPAARISGKWLFPRHLVDSWVEENTSYPSGGLMGAMLKDMVVVQGSDDWLFSRATDRFQGDSGVPVVSARAGSLGGLAALGNGKAHLTGYHVADHEVGKLAGRVGPCYVVNLFERQVGLLYDRGAHPGVVGLESVVELGLRFAERQPSSGTWVAVEGLLAEAGLAEAELSRVGPFTSHMDLALAVRTGRADAGVGIQVAAEFSGLDFIPLFTEPFKLAFPVSYASHPQVARFLEFILDELKGATGSGACGYDFDRLGRMESVGPPVEKR